MTQELGQSPALHPKLEARRVSWGINKGAIFLHQTFISPMAFCFLHPHSWIRTLVFKEPIKESQTRAEKYNGTSLWCSFCSVGLWINWLKPPLLSLTFSIPTPWISQCLQKSCFQTLPFPPFLQEKQECWQRWPALCCTGGLGSPGIRSKCYEGTSTVSVYSQFFCLSPVLINYLHSSRYVIFPLFKILRKKIFKTRIGEGTQPIHQWTLVSNFHIGD